MSAAQDRVPGLVGLGLTRLERLRLPVYLSRPSTPVEHAERAERLAVLADRARRWWLVLERWTLTAESSGVPVVFLGAVWTAVREEEAQARFWRDSAADWRRRAAGEPVCGVVGCGCGGACGVAA